MINTTALEKKIARFAKMFSKNRSGFQPDTPDGIGIYRSIGISRIFSTGLKYAHQS